jgi:hypothetical protein
MRANLLEAEVKKRKVIWRKEYFLQVEFEVKATIGLADAHFLCGKKKPPASRRLMTLTWSSGRWGKKDQ